jgi:hypothetical protein
VSKDRQIEGNDNSNIQLDILRLIWSEEIFEKTIMFLKSMSELKLDEATLILFLPLILFSPDRRDLVERSKILEIQSKYSFLLKKYIVWKYGMNKESLRIYNTLLLKMIELRTLHEMHSSILLDADPTQLDPFPLAIISSEKEEVTKLQITQTSIQQQMSTSDNSDNESNTQNTNNNSNNNHDEKIDDDKGEKQQQTVEHQQMKSQAQFSPRIMNRMHDMSSFNKSSETNETTNLKSVNSNSDLGVLTPASTLSCAISSISSPPQLNENGNTEKSSDSIDLSESS